MRFTHLLIVLSVYVCLYYSCDARKRRSSGGANKTHGPPCRLRSLVRYKLTVHTAWSRRTFPKHFPTHRPHAQWSTLVGRTHGSEYQMWKEGELASVGVKNFAEKGDTSLLNQEASQGYSGVLDSFTAPPITKGFGQTSAVIFANGRSTKISFMMRIVPSPDWFIGLSSVDLCHRRRWKKKVHINLRPYDAGTDRGLTFTAPNWADVPAHPISAITSSIPTHPASSFFYPDYEVLPRIAFMDLELMSDYKLKTTFLEEKQRKTTARAPPQTTTNNFIREEKSTPASASTRPTNVGPLLTSTETTKLKTTPGIYPQNASKQKGSTRLAEKEVTPEISQTVEARQPTPEITQTVEARPPTTVNTDVSFPSTTSNWVVESSTRPDKLKPESSLTPSPETSISVDISRETQSFSTSQQTHWHSSSVPSQTRQNAMKEHKSSLSSKPTLRELSRGSTNDKPAYVPDSDVSSRSHHNSSAALTDSRQRVEETHSDSSSVVNAWEPKKKVSQDSLKEPQFLEVSTHLSPRSEDSEWPSDCRVSEWSGWSACSQTCGFGHQERSRDVLILPMNGGANCPRLRQKALCGSMRNCKWNHFSFLGTGSRGRPSRRRPRRRRMKQRRTV